MLGVIGILRHKKRPIKKHLFAFPETHSVAFPVFEEISLIPIKPMGIEISFREVH
jgi:hypothetical protein